MYSDSRLDEILLDTFLPCYYSHFDLLLLSPQQGRRASEHHLIRLRHQYQKYFHLPRTDHPAHLSMLLTSQSAAVKLRTSPSTIKASLISLMNSTCSCTVLTVGLSSGNSSILLHHLMSLTRCSTFFLMKPFTASACARIWTYPTWPLTCKSRSTHWSSSTGLSSIIAVWLFLSGTTSVSSIQAMLIPSQ